MLGAEMGAGPGNPHSTHTAPLADCLSPNDPDQTARWDILQGVPTGAKAPSIVGTLEDISPPKVPINTADPECMAPSL